MQKKRETKKRKQAELDALNLTKDLESIPEDNELDLKQLKTKFEFDLRMEQHWINFCILIIKDWADQRSSDISGETFDMICQYCRNI